MAIDFEELDKAVSQPSIFGASMDPALLNIVAGLAGQGNSNFVTSQTIERDLKRQESAEQRKDSASQAAIQSSLQFSQAEMLAMEERTRDVNRIFADTSLTSTQKKERLLEQEQIMLQQLLHENNGDRALAEDKLDHWKDESGFNDKLAEIEQHIENGRLAYAQSTLLLDKINEEKGEIVVTQDEYDLGSLKDRHQASLDNIEAINTELERFNSLPEADRLAMSDTVGVPLQDALEQQTILMRSQAGMIRAIENETNLSDTVIQSDHRDAWDRLFGGWDEFEGYLVDAGADETQISRMQSLNEKIENGIYALSEVRDSLDDQNLSTTADLHTWDKDNNLGNVADYYIFAQEDGSYVLYGRNWTDSQTAIHLTEETHGAIVSEINVRTAEGTMTVGTPQQAAEYLATANGLTIAQLQKTREENGPDQSPEPQDIHISDASNLAP